MEKRIYLMIVLFFTFHSSLFTLDSAAQAQIRFGVKSGMNITNMSLNKDVFAVTNRTGFYLGPTAKVTLPILGLGLELSALYDERESEVVYGGITEDYIKLPIEYANKTLSQKQIAIPFNVIYQQGLGDIAAYTIYAGPQFGFNMSGNDLRTVMEKAYGWEWKDSALSINIGAGVVLLDHVMVSVNYNIACDQAGEFKFSDVTNNLISSDHDNKFHSWQIGLTYYF